MIEYIGYLASFIVLISFFNTDIKKLRIVNTIGCITFIVYGFLLPTYPIVLTNLGIVAINLYYLFKK